MIPDFITCLHLCARYGWTRAQVEAMPAERVKALPALEAQMEGE